MWCLFAIQKDLLRSMTGADDESQTIGKKDVR